MQPAGGKLAILVSSVNEPLPWVLIDGDAGIVARGMSDPFGPDAASGEQVHRIDLGAFKGPGESFRLRIGGAESRTFPILPEIFARLKYDALVYFYHNRSGAPVEGHYVGKQWARPAGHVDEIAECFSGLDNFGNDWPGCDYRLDVTGGWYDAGDHGKYVVNGGIALWTLLNLHERLKREGTAPFADGALSIPEAGNGIDDLLDISRAEMEFLMAMQVPEGKILRLPLEQTRPMPGLRFSQVDAGGMAHHKVADERWTPLPMPPHHDRERRLLYPPSTAATLNLAATAAQCARIWKDVDRDFSERCLSSARRAYKAALRNPTVYAAGDFAGSGNYGDAKLSDEFFWAAAELFATTGEAFFASALAMPDDTAQPSWAEVASLGIITLASAASDSEMRQQARARLVEMADGFLADRGKNGYAIPYAPAQYPWGSNAEILNRAMVLGYAYDLTGDGRYRNGVTDALDYVLGRNPLDQSYVSGYGARPLRNPHHRFWARQLDPSLPPPPPGALSGGPNSISFSDGVAKSMRGTCAPQTCWKDDIGAYTMNEVAINWNAPLAFVATFLDEGQAQ